MTQERFVKSREQAKRRKLTENKLSRINTIERENLGVESLLADPSIVIVGRNIGESHVYRAPNYQIGSNQIVKKSPFPSRRTRVLSNDDNGEMAASDEQGGSSERSGSNAGYINL